MRKWVGELVERTRELLSVLAVQEGIRGSMKRQRFADSAVNRIRIRSTSTPPFFQNQ